MGRLRAPTVGGAREPAASQVIFITEYVSSGSLKQFLKKTKKNHKAMNARVQGAGWVSVRARVGSGVRWAALGTGAGLGRGTSGPAAFPALTPRSPSAARPGSAGARRSCRRSGEGLGLPEHLPLAPPPPWHP